MLLALLASLTTVVLHANSAGADDTSACVYAAEKAESLRTAAHFQGARELFLTCADQKCPLVVRRDCTRWLSEVDAQIPSLVSRAQRADGSDMTNVRVYVDGHLVAAQLNGRAVPLDPGEHALRYVLPASEGGRSVDSKVLVAEGEQHRVVKLSFPETTRDAEPPRPSGARPDRSRPVPVLTWALGAVAVGGVVGFASLLLAGKSDYDSLENGCGRTRACTSGQVEGVRLDYIGADVSLGIGVLALGGALWSWASRPTVAAAAAGANPSPSLSLVPVRGGALAGWSRSF